MFTKDEQENSRINEQYYNHLENLSLQVRLKKLYDLFKNENYDIEQIKLHNQYSYEDKKTVLMKKQTQVVLGEGKEPYLESEVVEDLFDIINTETMRDAILKATQPAYVLNKENFAAVFQNMQDELKIPNFFNCDFNFSSKPLISKISFGDIKDVPYVIYNQESFDEIYPLQDRKESFLYKYIAEEMFNLFSHINDFISQKDNKLHIIFAENTKGWRRFLDLCKEDKDGIRFVSQEFSHNLNILMGIVIQKAPSCISKENAQDFLDIFEQGLERFDPLYKNFKDNNYLLCLKTDLQKKLILNELDNDTSCQKENKRRL